MASRHDSGVRRARHVRLDARSARNWHLIARMEKTMAMYQSDKRLCLDSAREKIVDCDSTDAAFLLVGEGGEIPEDEAARYGLLGKRAQARAEAAAEADQPAESDQKAVKSAPEDKAVKGSANKAAKDRE